MNRFDIESYNSFSRTGNPFSWICNLLPRIRSLGLQTVPSIQKKIRNLEMKMKLLNPGFSQFQQFVLSDCNLLIFKSRKRVAIRENEFFIRGIELLIHENGLLIRKNGLHISI